MNQRAPIVASRSAAPHATLGGRSRLCAGSPPSGPTCCPRQVLFASEESGDRDVIGNGEGDQGPDRRVRLARLDACQRHGVKPGILGGNQSCQFAAVAQRAEPSSEPTLSLANSCSEGRPFLVFGWTVGVARLWRLRQGTLSLRRLLLALNSS